ncbi:MULTISPECIES: hypothetical protein [unclassified Streptomyces]|uniref:hypothetical protein n=1 Tax=unclassified Streptomyces TaxID=2593676 RepID=UPI00090EEB11|nr:MULTISPECIES: hypothetical protein [unclassified Streptomyces]OII66104.1 hypothetical protein BJP39_28585 [Streptomyces sp. CC77]
MPAASAAPSASTEAYTDRNRSTTAPGTPIATGPSPGPSGAGEPPEPEASPTESASPGASASEDPPEASPPASTAPARPGPSLLPSMAGRPEGVGRPRPGRFPFPFPSLPSPSASDSATASTSASPSASPSPRDGTATATAAHSRRGPAWEAVPKAGSPGVVLPWSTTSPEPRHQGSLATGATVDRRVPVLTLGLGLAFMGAGIGFLGLRLRRG